MGMKGRGQEEKRQVQTDHSPEVSAHKKSRKLKASLTGHMGAIYQRSKKLCIHTHTTKEKKNMTKKNIKSKHKWRNFSVGPLSLPALQQTRTLKKLEVT